MTDYSWEKDNIVALKDIKGDLHNVKIEVQEVTARISTIRRWIAFSILWIPIPFIFFGTTIGKWMSDVQFNSGVALVYFIALLWAIWTILVDVHWAMKYGSIDERTSLFWSVLVGVAILLLLKGVIS